MNTPTATVAIDDLRYAWRGQPTLIDIPQLHIDAGERLFLEGPSGSGKSTLLGLLGGVLLPDSGRLAVLGTETASLRPGARDRFRADHIGFIFQQFNLVPYLGLVENVTLGCRFSPRRRQRLGDTVNSEAERLLGALGLDVQRLRRHAVTELSVGQQQRVAAARALIGGPELVIADEPTSALDATARATFIELLFNECRRAGSTLVFVSHDPALAALFPRSLRLTDINRAVPRAQAA